MKITTTSAVLIVVAGIGFASAQGVDGRPLVNLLGLAQSLVAQAVPFLVGLAMVTFFYGLVMFIWKGKEGGDELAKSKQFMMYSILAIFVMVSVWGIISLVQDIIGVNPNARPTSPGVPMQAQ